jgi:hypothetical protein
VTTPATATPEPTLPPEPTAAAETAVAATPTQQIVIVPTATISAESQERMERWLDDNFPDAQWSAVSGSQLAALDPTRSVERVTDSPCIDGAMYIARGGGFICGGDYLVLTDNAGLREEVRSVEALRAEFAPVASPEEAAGFAEIVYWSLRIDGVAPSDAGFLVRAIEPNFFGCGLHLPTRVVVQVAADGIVSVLDAEPEPDAEPGTPVICVD